MSAPTRYRTLSGHAEHVADPIKKSRFIGWAAPAGTEDEALALVDAAAERWPDARHLCWAYRLADGRVRSSDDGEPGGSAGRPILAQIEGHELHDVAVVVARWFGGVKLGVGGLIRAYGGTAGRTLDGADVVEVAATVDLEFRHGWDDTGAVQGVVAARQLDVVDTAWAEDVTLVLRVPAEQVDAVCAALRDATAGRVTPSGTVTPR